MQLFLLFAWLLTVFAKPSLATGKNWNNASMFHSHPRGPIVPRKQLPGASLTGVVGCIFDDPYCSVLTNVEPAEDFPIPPVIPTPVVYVLWYGDWSQPKKDLIKNLLKKIGGSNYFKLLKGYQLGKESKKPTGNLAWGGEASVVLTDPVFYPDASPIFQSIMAKFKKNKNGIYLALSSPNVAVNGGCDFCGTITLDSFFDTAYRMAWIGDLANQCGVRCSRQGPNQNPGLDSLIQNMIMRVITLSTIPFFNEVVYSSAEVCWGAPSIQTPKNGGFYNIVVNNQYYLLNPIVEFRSDGQFCSMQPFCTGMSALGYTCLSLYDHPADTYNPPIALPNKDLITLATACRKDPNCIGFTSDGELKQIINPIERSTSYNVDLYFKKCQCSACGSSAKSQVFASCGRSNSTCSASSKKNPGCWAKFPGGTIGNQECVCEDQAEVHGAKCTDPIRITAGPPAVPRFFSNVATPLTAPAPMKNGACQLVGHVVYFSVTVPVGVVCSVDLCGSSEGFDSVIAIYKSCSDTVFVECNDDSENGNCARGASELQFTTTQSTYILGVGTYNGDVAGQFSLNFNCA